MAFLSKVVRARLTPAILSKLYQARRENQDRYDSVSQYIRVAIIEKLRNEGYDGN